MSLFPDIETLPRGRRYFVAGKVQAASGAVANRQSIQLASNATMAVIIRSWHVYTDCGAAAATHVIRLYRATAVSGATAVTPSPLLQADAAATAVVREAVATDSGATTSITATLGVALWSINPTQMRTSVGTTGATTGGFEALKCPLILLPAEAFVMRVDVADGAAAVHLFDMVFDEVTSI